MWSISADVAFHYIIDIVELTIIIKSKIIDIQHCQIIHVLIEWKLLHFQGKFVKLFKIFMIRKMTITSQKQINIICKTIVHIP